jgi:deoxycytidine triphosphate deaminase
MATQSLFPSHEASAVLTASRIRELVESGRLISRDTFNANLLASCSYDLRVGDIGVQSGEGSEIDLTNGVMTLGPGGYAGIVSFEKLHLPLNVMGRIGSKRSYSYDGVILLTGTIVDPGYEGHLLFGIYNASQKRFVIRKNMKICTIVFEMLPRDAGDALHSDPDLRDGRIPNDFLNKMANMEVLPWMQISERVKQIELLTKDIIDLKARYDDVLEPIKTLTSNVSKVTDDVAALTSRSKEIANEIDKLADVTNANASQLGQLASTVQTLATEVRIARDHSDRAHESTKKHEDRIVDLDKRFSSFSLAVKVVWALVLIAVSVAATLLATRLLS